jgi:DNA-binding response OmpR family regulator
MPLSNPRLRIMVVEDDGPSRRSLERLFRLNGADVVTACSVEGALAELHWRPNWVVLDLHLPQGEGEDILRAIRDRELPIRVAVVTGSADRARLVALQELEPDCVLIKPIQFSSLLECVKLSNN